MKFMVSTTVANVQSICWAVGRAYSRGFGSFAISQVHFPVFYLNICYCIIVQKGLGNKFYQH